MKSYKNIELCKYFFYLYINEMLYAFHNRHNKDLTIKQDAQKEEILNRALLASVSDITRFYHNTVNGKVFTQFGSEHTKEMQSKINPLATIERYIAQKIFSTIKKISDHGTLNLENFIQITTEAIEQSLEESKDEIGEYFYYTEICNKYKDKMNSIASLSNPKTEVLKFLQNHINDLDKSIDKSKNNQDYEIVYSLSLYYIANGFIDAKISEFLVFFLNQSNITWACSAFVLFMFDTQYSDNNKFNELINSTDSLLVNAADHFSELNILSDKSCSLTEHFYLYKKSYCNETLYYIHHTVKINISSDQNGKISVTYLEQKSDTHSLETIIQQSNDKAKMIKKCINELKQNNFFIKLIILMSIVLEVLLVTLLCFLVCDHKKVINTTFYKPWLVAVGILVGALFLSLICSAVALYINHHPLKEAYNELKKATEFYNFFNEVKIRCDEFSENVNASKKFLDFLDRNTRIIRSRNIPNVISDVTYDCKSPSSLIKFTDMVEKKIFPIKNLSLAKT